MQNKTWVIVAESSRAKIYELNKKNSPLIVVKDFTNTPSAMHNQLFASDISSYNRISQAQGNQQTRYQVPMKSDDSQGFARKISSHLHHACSRGKFDKLIIMSSPAFLGELRKQLRPSTNKFIVSEIGKNLVRHGTESIKAHLPFSY